MRPHRRTAHFRFGRQFRLRRSREFRKCATAVSEHWITHLELRDGGADGLLRRQHINPWVLKLTAAEQELNDSRSALQHVVVERIDGGGVNLDQDFLLV